MSSRGWRGVCGTRGAVRPARASGGRPGGEGASSPRPLLTAPRRAPLPAPTCQRVQVRGLGTIFRQPLLLLAPRHRPGLQLRGREPTSQAPEQAGRTGRAAPFGPGQPGMRPATPRVASARSHFAGTAGHRLQPRVRAELRTAERGPCGRAPRMPPAHPRRSAEGKTCRKLNAQCFRQGS